jgi:aryl-alcohol dehydrogenase
LNFSGRRRDGTSCLHDQNGEVSSHFFGQSSFATHAIVAAKNAVKVTKDAPIELLGPLGCGIMTGAGAVFHALQLKQGESLLVTGGGPVGLSAVMAGVVRGADMILVSDPLPSRRAMAIDLGATHVIDPAAGELAEQVRAIVPAGVENVLDTSGIAPVIEAAVGTLAVRGRLATVGVPRSADAAVSLNILQMLSLGIQISGVTEGNADPQTFLPQLVDLFLAGKFPIDRMISSYRLDQINEAIADQHAGRCVKAILTM